MTDYTHLKKLDVNEDSEAEYVFDDVVVGRAEDGSNIYASIFFRPMTEDNRVYLNERIRQSTERAESIAQQPRGKDADKVQNLVDRMEGDREAFRKIVSKTCALRWGNAPLDVDGKSHEFSEAECYDFLKALPNYMLERLRTWVSNTYNFVDPVAFASGGGVVKDPAALGNS